jgi:hypothetical protein
MMSRYHESVLNAVLFDFMNKTKDKLFLDLLVYCYEEKDIVPHQKGMDSEIGVRFESLESYCYYTMQIVREYLLLLNKDFKSK